MTIEIKQLVIRAVVEERRERLPAALPAGSGASERVRQAASPAEPSLDRGALIAECTSQVLRELRRERGR